MIDSDQDAPSPSTDSKHPDITPMKEKLPQPESRYKRIFLRALRWSLGILIAFSFGILVTILVLYLPSWQKLAKTDDRLAQANQQIDDIESQTDERIDEIESQAQQQIDDLKSQIEELSALEIENEDLHTKLNQSDMHVALLSARVDIAMAQLALMNQDPTKAHIALSKTPETLDTLASLLEPGQRKIVTDMQERLELAVTELDDNEYAAQSDLDVLARTLVELEVTFFAGP